MTGLVIGKFSPLHLGHDLLIRTALQHSSALTIVVCGSVKHRYSLEQRLEWLNEAYPEAVVFGLNQDGFNTTRPEEWVMALQRLLPAMPERYFTSELHGKEYAELLGMSHFIVDAERERVPVSATKINEDHAQFGHFLHPVVRLK